MEVDRRHDVCVDEAAAAEVDEQRVVAEKISTQQQLGHIDDH